jgi:putative oxidoreductase
MSVVYKFLFPSKPDDAATSLLLLAFRVLFGVLLMNHGLQKFTHFSTMSGSFPDPLGVGSSVSLGLAIFAELFCSMGFLFGILYRLALIPMIFTMGVVVFAIYGGDPFATKELPFVYLMVFVLMYIAGPGKYSVDRLIAISIRKR